MTFLCILDPTPEESPKWKALKEVLEEIKETNNRIVGKPGRVVIAAYDDRTCVQIKEVSMCLILNLRYCH